MDIKNLGQVFTPDKIVSEMVKLITIEDPLILEPSSGNGAFYFHLKGKYKKIKALEIDPKVAHEGAELIDFFDLKEEEKFDVIIGNPPYVDFRNINTKIKKNFTTECIHKPNLYMLFLEKSLRHLKQNGELIFIIPVEWIVSSSFKKTLKNIYENYSIQYFKIVDENIWENAAVTTAIFKIKKGNHKKRLKYYLTKNGKLIFGEKPILQRDFNLKVRVGAASGNNSFFRVENGDTEFITSQTERTGKLMNISYIDSNEEWIRKLPSPMSGFTYQIFVNAKTRKEEPFYYMNSQKKSDLIYYDASVLCIYVDGTKEEMKKFVSELNKKDWKKMGIYRNGKFNFTQSLLAGVLEK